LIKKENWKLAEFQARHDFDKVSYFCAQTQNQDFDKRVVVYLYHLYPPVTIKRRWCYVLDESASA